MSDAEMVKEARVIASTVTQPRQLTAEEIAEIEHEMSLYPDKKAVGLEALKIVQKHQGWVSDESLLGIARFLDMPVADLEGVATFFNLVFRQPVGRNVLLFCNSVSCWIMGCESLRARLKESLGIDFGETTPDNEFTLIPVPCLGDCDNAPVIMVGESMHRRLSPADIDALVKQYRQQKSPGQAAVPVVKKAATPKKATAAKKATTAKKSTVAKKSTAAKKSTVAKKSTATKKATTAKKVAGAEQSATAKKKSSTTKKAAATKKSTTAKKSTAAKKATAKKSGSVKKATAAKKTPAKKVTAKKSTAPAQKAKTPKPVNTSDTANGED